MESSGHHGVRGDSGSRPNCPASVDGGQASHAPSIHIFETIVHALIDSGSTHSYVCNSIPSLGSLSKSETEYDILVTNPLGHSVIVDRVYKDCPIRIREYELPGDLIRLSFREFDVILGMDWLS